MLVLFTSSYMRSILNSVYFTVFDHWPVGKYQLQLRVKTLTVKFVNDFDILEHTFGNFWRKYSSGFYFYLQNKHATITSLSVLANIYRPIFSYNSIVRYETSSPFLQIRLIQRIEHTNCIIYKLQQGNHDSILRLRLTGLFHSLFFTIVTLGSHSV